MSTGPLSVDGHSSTAHNRGCRSIASETELRRVTGSTDWPESRVKLAVRTKPQSECSTGITLNEESRQAVVARSSRSDLAFDLR